MKNELTDNNLQLIRELYNIGFYRINTKEEAARFGKKNMIHRVQLIFSADAIMTMKDNMDANTIYVLTDVFNISMLVFLLDDELYILGPFTPLLHTKQDALRVLEQNNIKDLNVNIYLRYRNLFPTISEDMAVHIATSFLKTNDSEYSGRRIKKPSFFEDESQLLFFEEDRENFVNLLQLRYDNEKSFFNCVTKGDSEAALNYLSKMQQDVSYIKRIGSTLENERIGCAITRTTLRIAALKAGLPVYVIDKISSKNTKLTIEETDIEKILDHKKEMVKEFCEAIMQLNTNKHSAVINNAIYYLENYYQDDITLDLLTAKMSISKSYLLTLFRKELNTTPGKYLRKVRVTKACQLLESSQKSIQQISEAVGIADSNYFVKLFKKELDMTPSQYRKKHNSTVG